MGRPTSLLSGMWGTRTARPLLLLLHPYRVLVPFRDFTGNETTVRHLREALAAGRLPHSLILTGPRGAGKYTLAVMLAQAANCLYVRRPAPTACRTSRLHKLRKNRPGPRPRSPLC